MFFGQSGTALLRSKIVAIERIRFHSAGPSPIVYQLSLEMTFLFTPLSMKTSFLRRWSSEHFRQISPSKAPELGAASFFEGVLVGVVRFQCNGFTVKPNGSWNVIVIEQFILQAITRRTITHGSRPSTVRIYSAKEWWMNSLSSSTPTSWSRKRSSNERNLLSA